MSYIRFENLCKSYGEKEVLRDINLEVEKGTLVTLLGPSGCGKSTLLRCLAGLETVTSGKVYLDDKDITEVSPKDRGIGMVFQQYSLFPNMTVEQNVAFGLKIKKEEPAVIKKKVDEIIKIVGLSEQVKQYPSQLSGGQQQRVGIARALAVQPAIVFADEPTGNLDSRTAEQTLRLFRTVVRRFSQTWIMVTHDHHLAGFADTIVSIGDGRVTDITHIDHSAEDTTRKVGP